MTKFNPEAFTSPFDVMHTGALQEKQAAEGAKLASDGLTLHIGVNGVWSASKPNQHVSSYEKLAYHACVAQLVEGFLKAGGKCLFHGFRGIEGEVTL